MTLNGLHKKKEGHRNQSRCVEGGSNRLYRMTIKRVGKNPWEVDKNRSWDQEGGPEIT